MRRRESIRTSTHSQALLFHFIHTAPLGGKYCDPIFQKRKPSLGLSNAPNLTRPNVLGIRPKSRRHASLQSLFIWSCVSLLDKRPSAVGHFKIDRKLTIKALISFFLSFICKQINGYLWRVLSIFPGIIHHQYILPSRYNWKLMRI